MQEDLIINKLLEHDERLGWLQTNTFTKDDARSLNDTLEGIATICKLQLHLV